MYKVHSVNACVCQTLTVGVPAVGDLPVVYAALSAPAHDANGVPTLVGARHVLVDAALVGLEVAVDAEGSLHWPVAHDRVLDRRHWSISSYHWNECMEGGS